MMNPNLLLVNINLTDQNMLQKIKHFLHDFDLKLDKIDYCLALFNQDGALIATASKYFNTIKAIAIDSKYQNQQIANQLIGEMTKIIYANNFQSVFIFSRPDLFSIFQKLGYFQIFVNDTFSFATNRFDLWEAYLQYLHQQLPDGQKNQIHSVVIVNANPFTNGHLYLIQQAQAISDVVFVIVVKEEGALFSFATRYRMVKAGIKHLKNVFVLKGSEFLVSKSVFPAYFLASETAVIKEQATLDANIFATQIAKQLKVTIRVVGSEPFSPTTNLYNQILTNICQRSHINLVVIKRKKFQSNEISATMVRKLFITGNFKQIAKLVPPTTVSILKELDYQSFSTIPHLKELINKNY